MLLCLLEGLCYATTYDPHLCALFLVSELRVETETSLRTCDNCVESNSEWRSGVLGQSISTSTTLGSSRSNGWIIDVALSNKELTNEALRSDLMLLRLSQSLIIYIGLSSVYLDALESLFLAFLLVLNASRVFACFREASPPACLYLLYHKISQESVAVEGGGATLGWAGLVVWKGPTLLDRKLSLQISLN